MRTFYRLPFLLTLAALATVLCGCPPLRHEIFVRNITADTAYLTLLYKSPFDTISKRSISVRAKKEIFTINNRALSRLNENFNAHAENEMITLAIPPKSTVFISDVINSFYLFADKTLIIRKGDHSDTMTANYPYKDLKNLKRKRDKGYNYFYRTIVYYDIN